jgi:hypothetical protein
VLVYAEPGVVDEHSGSSVELFLDCHGGRKAEVCIRQGVELGEWEHNPEACVNEVGELPVEEVPVHHSRWVCAALGIVDYLVGVPWGVIQVDLDALVS